MKLGRMECEIGKGVDGGKGRSRGGGILHNIRGNCGKYVVNV